MVREMEFGGDGDIGQSKGGGVYYLIPMSLAIYNEQVKNELFDAREFKDEAELRQAFWRW